MKKLILVIILLVGGILYSFAQSNDFRGFTWGASLSEVQSAEKTNFINKVKDNELVYSDEIAGSECKVMYIFNDNDKLISGIYIFTKSFDNAQLYLQDYNKFKTLLTEKYRAPLTEVYDMENQTDSIKQDNYGQLVANGDLTIYTIWKTKRSLIKIMLTSRDQHPSLEIHYTTRSLNELENKAELKNALLKL